jgi:hypothetical protein
VNPYTEAAVTKDEGRYRWNTGAHGIYLFRNWYDEGPNGDNWSYINPVSLCIVDHRPVGEFDRIAETPAHIAGPFETLDAAKTAYLLIYGSGDGDER